MHPTYTPVADTQHRCNPSNKQQQNLEKLDLLALSTRIAERHTCMREKSFLAASLCRRSASQGPLTRFPREIFSSSDEFISCTKHSNFKLIAAINLPASKHISRLRRMTQTQTTAWHEKKMRGMLVCVVRGAIVSIS